MTEIQQRSADLTNLIFAYDYYTRCFHAAMEECNMTVADIMVGEVTDENLVSMWNVMWGMLPDSRAIHRQPFDDLCDLCTADYRGDEPPTPI
jgi:hypothetical protein